MAYCTNTEVKTLLNITQATWDTLLTSLIAAAQRAIEQYTGRVFEAAADSTRYFTVGVDTIGDSLYLDEDLCAITSVITNADNGSGGTALTTAEYVTEPRNRTPYFKIRILHSSSNEWGYTSDPENGVTVTGKWAYSATAPADIKMACERLAAYYYKMREAQVFDTTALPGAGVITIPKGMPADVKMMLEPYRRLV